jgi:hypothetical protein
MISPKAAAAGQYKYQKTESPNVTSLLAAMNDSAAVPTTA